MEKVKTILYPISLPGNKSFDVKKQYLEKNGFEVYSFSEGIKKIHEIKIINLNFYETIHSKNLIVCLLKLIAKIVILIYLKLRKVKIVYTIHNKQGHDSRYVRLDVYLMRLLCRQSDKIVILCNETKNYLRSVFGKKFYFSIKDKINRIPLVSYEDVYIDNGKNYRKDWKINDNEMAIMFIGGIRRYKNIELIVQAAEVFKGKNIRFIIAGGGEENYIESLRKLIQNKKIDNIVFVPKFVENTEMAAYLRSSDIMILPYEKKSVLNSGTCLLAFSHKRNVICPLIGTIKDIPEGLCYSYDYVDDAQHIAELCKAIQSASDDFFNNNVAFRNKQIELYNLSKKDNSVEAVADKYTKLYLELLGRRYC